MERKIIAWALLPWLLTSPLALGKGRGLISNIEKAGEKLSDSPSSLPKFLGPIGAHTLSLGIGQTFLFGDLRKYGASAITTDLYYSFSASYSFHFLLNLHSSAHKIDTKEAVIKGLALGIKGKLWQFDALSPYALLGLGFYAPQASGEGDSKLSKDKVVLGLHAGAGLDLQLTPQISTGLLFHFHNPFDNPERDTKEAEGLYSKILVMVGYTF